MNLMRYLEEMRRFKEEHGYYPTFGQTQRRQQEQAQERFIPKKRRRQWK